jgi:Domain of unknown function (DU1801)
MRLEAGTIEEYFRAAGERGDDLRSVDRIITSTAPQLRRQLFSGPSITMVGYGEMAWERKSGSGVWPLIGMAVQKHYIALYVAAVKDGETLAQRYQDRLGRTNNGKNCIRFRGMSDIEPDELANAIRDAVDWAEEQEVVFGRNCAAPVDGDDGPKNV